MSKSRRYDPRDDDYGNNSYFHKKTDKFRQRRAKKLRKIVKQNDSINPNAETYMDYGPEEDGRL